MKLNQIIQMVDRKIESMVGLSTEDLPETPRLWNFIHSLEGKKMETVINKINSKITEKFIMKLG